VDVSLSNTDQEQIYETLNTRGWDLLVEGFRDQYETCNQVLGCDTERELHTRRGMMIVYQQLIDLRDDVLVELGGDPLEDEPDADL
jgi:hypothetical protein